MVTFDAKIFVLVILSVLLLSKAALSSYVCPPGDILDPETFQCIPWLKGGPGGRWKGGFGSEVAVTLPEPLCPPGEVWVASMATCIPYVNRGPGGRWKSGPGGRWKIGNLLPNPRPFAFDIGPVCPPGEIWVEVLQDCVPWLKGPGGRWKSGPGGRWKSGPGGRWKSGPGGRWKTGNLLPTRPSGGCPPGWILGPGFLGCIPDYSAVLYDTDQTCHRCWG